MKLLLFPSIGLLVTAAGTPTTPNQLPRRPAAPAATGSDRQISPTLPVAPKPASPPPAPGRAAPANPPGAPGQSTAKPIVKESNQAATCEEIRRKARYGIYFEKVDIEKLVQTVADATCKTFILPENIRGKISIIGPENGKTEVDADQFYAAFLSALDANGLTVYPYGRFLRIVEKAKAKSTNIPLIIGPGDTFTTNEQMVTRLFKVKYVEAEQLRAVLQAMVSQGGDTLVFQPDTIIVNDVASNIHRLQKLVEQLDVRSSSDEIRVIQIKYASAQELADKIQKLFESKTQRPGQRPGGPVPPPTPPGGVTGSPGMPGQPATAEAGGGPATLSQIIPDDRTNKLIIVASPAAFERINSLVKAIDIPVSGEGRINVYALENHAAEEIAATLQALAQGTTNRPPRAGPSPTPPGGGIPPGGGAPRAASAAELFSGEVRISADKSTNSLVIIASQADYRSLVRVIEKLDIPRRQVFVEAVIMEVNIDRTSEFGVQLHQEIGINSDQGKLPVLFGTKYSKQGAPPSFSLANLLNFGGFLAGIQGPNVPELQKLGISIPQFGVVLHALQQSSDVNVLSTPHILTSDNEEAEITVGQNVPFQAGFSPANLNLGTGLGTTPGTTPGAGTGVPGLGGVNPFIGGLGSFFAPITRQNVELKLTIKPQINESDFIRMVISEQTEEIASQDPVLGPTTSKRTAKTTVVAKDQETVVLGGIMQDRTIESVSKTPILGDIPLLGHLFREQSHHKVKTNLLLFLTPYIIKDKSDFRRIFERKLQERQQFVEEFYGQIPGYDVAIDFSRKAGPIAKLGQKVQHEEMRLENGGPGLPGERVLRPRGDVGGELPPPRRRVVEEPVFEPAPAPIRAPAPTPVPLPELGPEGGSPPGATPAPGPAVVEPDLSEPPGSSLTAQPPAPPETPPPTPNPPNDVIRVQPPPSRREQ